MRVAHLFAQASPQVRAEAIEASEFPELIQKYSIQGVPKTVINEDADFVGAQPEPAVLQHVLSAIGKA